MLKRPRIYYDRERILGMSKWLGLVPYSWDSTDEEETNWYLVIANLWIDLGFKLPEIFRFSITNCSRDKSIIVVGNYKSNGDFTFNSFDYPTKTHEYATSYLVEETWIERPYYNNRAFDYFIRQVFTNHCNRYEMEHNGKIISYLVKEHYAPKWLKFKWLKRLYSKLMDNDFTYAIIDYDDGKRTYQYQADFITDLKISTKIYVETHEKQFGGKDER